MITTIARNTGKNNENKVTRTQGETSTHKLNTKGKEEQVRTIRAGQTINKAGCEESDMRRHG